MYVGGAHKTSVHGDPRIANAALALVSVHLRSKYMEFFASNWPTTALHDPPV